MNNFFTAFVVVMVIAVIFLIAMRFDSIPHPQVTTPQADGAAIIRNLVAGKSVSKLDFENTFPLNDMSKRSASVRRAAAELGVEDRYITPWISDSSLIISQDPRADKMPWSIREKICPTTAPTTQPEAAVGK